MNLVSVQLAARSGLPINRSKWKLNDLRLPLNLWAEKGHTVNPNEFATSIYARRQGSNNTS